MLRHDTPPELLTKFLTVFNLKFTRTLAKETYISMLSAFRHQVISQFTFKEDKDTYFDVAKNQFKSKLTAQKLTTRVKLTGGSSLIGRLDTHVSKIGRGRGRTLFALV